MNVHQSVAVLLAIAIVGTGGVAAVGDGPSLPSASSVQLAEDADGTNGTTVEDGEMEREVRHPDARDDDDSFPVAQSAALETARSALSSDAWVLVERSVHEESGYYEFEFVFDGNGSGEAEVRVDGSTGEVFRLEEEIEQDEDDEEAETPEPTEDDDEETEAPEPTEDDEDEDETETETPEPTEDDEDDDEDDEDHEDDEDDENDDDDDDDDD